MNEERQRTGTDQLAVVVLGLLVALFVWKAGWVASTIVFPLRPHASGPPFTVERLPFTAQPPLSNRGPWTVRSLDGQHELRLDLDDEAASGIWSAGGRSPHATIPPGAVLNPANLRVMPGGRAILHVADRVVYLDGRQHWPVGGIALWGAADLRWRVHGDVLEVHLVGDDSQTAEGFAGRTWAHGRYDIVDALPLGGFPRQSVIALLRWWALGCLALAVFRYIRRRSPISPMGVAVALGVLAALMGLQIR